MNHFSNQETPLSLSCELLTSPEVEIQDQRKSVNPWGDLIQFGAHSDCYAPNPAPAKAQNQEKVVEFAPKAVEMELEPAKVTNTNSSDNDYYRSDEADTKGSSQEDRDALEMTPEMAYNISLARGRKDPVAEFLANLSPENFSDYEMRPQIRPDPGIFLEDQGPSNENIFSSFSGYRDYHEVIQHDERPAMMSQTSKSIRKESSGGSGGSSWKKHDKKFDTKNVLKNQVCNANQWVDLYMNTPEWRKYAETKGTKLKEVRAFSVIMRQLTNFNFDAINNVWGGKDIDADKLPGDLREKLVKKFGDNLPAVAEVYRAGVMGYLKRGALNSYFQKKIKKTKFPMIATHQGLLQGLSRRDLGNHHEVLVSIEVE